MEIVQGIILKTSPYSETQKIIRIYTKEKGYLSMISPSVVFKRKTKTVHLLQISEIEFFENEKSDLHKLRQISPIINLPELYFDIFKMNILLLWGEILNLILKNEGKNEELFDYLTHSIEYLNSTHNDIGNFNLYFLYRLAGFIGFRINTSSWQENYVFNINDGSFYPSDPATPYISGPNIISKVLPKYDDSLSAIFPDLVDCCSQKNIDLPSIKKARSFLLPMYRGVSIVSVSISSIASFPICSSLTAL